MLGNDMTNRRSLRLFVPMIAGAFLAAAPALHAQEAEKPNILIIWGDDIGQYNTSAYNRGMMGYRTPNIDRVAAEGALFTDWYGQQSCTAGRAAFITGQSPIRTGLTKVGLPGAPEGMMVEDPTIAGLLKPLGYATGQFGKNHLGDRDEMLPLAAEAILHRVGEAVSRLPEGFVTAHPQVRWRLMKGMRNLIAHECQVVDSSIVWNTLAHELPVDAASIRAILDAADTGT